MSNIMIVPIAFSVDEAEFLSTALKRASETAQEGSAEQFWLARLRDRVQQAVVDVVAADSAARLAASSAPPGFPLPPVSVTSVIGAGGGGGSSMTAVAVGGGGGGGATVNGICTCGYQIGSSSCHRKRANGMHP